MALLYRSDDALNGTESKDEIYARSYRSKGSKS